LNKRSYSLTQWAYWWHAGSAWVGA
jgi:hypothetical protein